MVNGFMILLQKKVRMFYSLGNPGSLEVKAAVVDLLITCYYQNYVLVNDLFFSGANLEAIGNNMML